MSRPGELGMCVHFVHMMTKFIGSAQHNTFYPNKKKRFTTKGEYVNSASILLPLASIATRQQFLKRKRKKRLSTKHVLLDSIHPGDISTLPNTNSSKV
jgi:hypothetical protein